MTVNIVDIHYFGNLSYYKMIYSSTYIIFERYDQHKKLSFANRCVIIGANGPLTLSIPLQKGRDQRTIMKDIRIANDEKWQKDHWKGIVSCYNGSPWFKYLDDELAELYSTRYEFLLDWNLACLNWSLRKLRKELVMGFTEEYKVYPDDDDSMKDLRHLVMPNSPSGSGGELIRYRQVFEDRMGFKPDLSVLDLLFCEGPKRADLLLREQLV